MDGSSYYIPAAAMEVALTVKAPTLVRSWRDPLLRSVCALLALAGLVFFFAAPPTIEKVNDLTGLTNVSAPLVYCLLDAFSAASLVLIVNWRGGPPTVTRRINRRIITGYAVVIVALGLLFALGAAPVERLRDFDTYYAGTPFIREMIVLYLAAMTVAAFAMSLMCWRWALQVRGLLRAGLLIIVIGYLFNLAYLATKFTAVVARWNGGNLDDLSTYAAPVLASVGAQVCAVGFCLPLAGRRVGDSWTTWATYRRLGPLWRELRPVSAHVGGEVRISWWSSAQLQVTQRESDIHDGMLRLYPYFDSKVHARTYDAAVAAGSDAVHARAEADAAMVTAAVRAKAADPEGRVISATEVNPASAAAPESPRDLVRMSMALRRSSVVAAVRGQGGGPLR
ncbi:MAB_1171c family putative transporter [Streptomyces chiangmaiensis]|uniref:MAB_1171c family putative transporter n=1 Tax=Streptomyces chiangmaiensis TaxID=766497 RepID=A0ABU7FK18_9ACTN|nr:MAB_1171c family putative transporter [Streptomyces chiangmaiensis]MED7824460.1 MAB_1171c family putative transporter [Streptomyces chiangmaiensis]